jgi:hypothetical protein
MFSGRKKESIQLHNRKKGEQARGEYTCIERVREDFYFTWKQGDKRMK